jgi:hypothetical protein
VRKNVVTDFTLYAHIGHKALKGLGVEARGVVGIGIAVGVAIMAIEKIYEVVAL